MSFQCHEQCVVPDSVTSYGLHCDRCVLCLQVTILSTVVLVFHRVRVPVGLLGETAVWAAPFVCVTLAIYMRFMHLSG